MRRLSGRSPLTALCLVLAVTLAPLAPAGATPRDDNPLAGRPWGVHQGAAEMSWPPYERATGREMRLLGRIALQPKATWFGKWIPDRDIAGKVRAYVDNATGGDRDVLVPMTLFRMVPWEQEACERVSTRAEKESYKRFVGRFARALGRPPVAADAERAVPGEAGARPRPDHPYQG